MLPVQNLNITCDRMLRVVVIVQTSCFALDIANLSPYYYVEMTHVRFDDVLSKKHCVSTRRNVTAKPQLVGHAVPSRHILTLNALANVTFCVFGYRVVLLNTCAMLNVMLSIWKCVTFLWSHFLFSVFSVIDFGNIRDLFL